MLNVLCFILAAPLQLYIKGKIANDEASVYYDARNNAVQARSQNILDGWSVPDPLAEKYYGFSSYAFCANNPVLYVDPDGLAWYYNSTSGAFVAHIEDDNDRIYLLTSEQIKEAKGDADILSSYQNVSNTFGQLGLEGNLSEDVAIAVFSDLLSRANVTEEDGSTPIVEGVYINVNMSRKVESNGVEKDPNYAEYTPGGNMITVYPAKGFFRGYDTMLILVHELGHIYDYRQHSMSKNKQVREQFADKFAKGHWVYDKASSRQKNVLYEHYIQEGGKEW